MTLDDVVSICMHVPMPGVHENENTIIWHDHGLMRRAGRLPKINGDEFLFLTTVTRATC